MQVYQAGIREIRTKLEILDEEFRVYHDHNPIHHIESRLKSPQSIIQKLIRRGAPVNIESMRSELYDVAGVRVIVQYLDDVERVASQLLGQDDVKLIVRRDYVSTPKESGYRSLHLVVEVPVFLSTGKRKVPVEIQIRSIAMDFWASLEHRLKYKQSEEVPSEIRERLRDCAE
ncbi:MAG: GTP pyrophosphokinase family protein, partial [Clostridia bacterium]|nr:GTP pyrophosphokinase family protein [Clostridia bacterium]